MEDVCKKIGITLIPKQIEAFQLFVNIHKNMDILESEDLDRLNIQGSNE